MAAVEKVIYFSLKMLFNTPIYNIDLQVYGRIAIIQGFAVPGEKVNLFITPGSLIVNIRKLERTAIKAMLNLANTVLKHQIILYLLDGVFRRGGFL